MYARSIAIMSPLLNVVGLMENPGADDPCGQS